MFREHHDLIGDGVTHCLGSMACQGRTVLHSGFSAMAFHRRQAQQHGEPGRALHQRADGGLVKPDDVGSDRSALPAFELVGFSGPPAEPDVRLSPHPALHRFMPPMRVILLSWCSPMVWGCEHAGSDIE